MTRYTVKTNIKSAYARQKHYVKLHALEKNRTRLIGLTHKGTNYHGVVTGIYGRQFSILDFETNAEYLLSINGIKHINAQGLTMDY